MYEKFFSYESFFFDSLITPCLHSCTSSFYLGWLLWVCNNVDKDQVVIIKVVNTFLILVVLSGVLKLNDVVIVTELIHCCD